MISVTEPSITTTPSGDVDPQQRTTTEPLLSPRKRARDVDEDTMDGVKQGMDELYDVLEKLLFVLSSEDEEGYFARPINTEANPLYIQLVKKPMDFGSMQNKLVERSYRTLAEFQDDFDTVMKNAMLFHPVTDDVYQLAARLHKFGTRLINSLYGRFPKNLTVEAPDEDKDGPVTTTPGDTNKTIKEAKERIFRTQKFALSQRGPDGTYFFSSTHTKPLEDMPLVDELLKVNIVPTYSGNGTDIPLLKSMMQPPRPSAPDPLFPPPRKVAKPNSPSTVHFNDYGLFYSFAPSYASANATLSPTESIKVKTKDPAVVVLEPEEDEAPSGCPASALPLPTDSVVPIYRGDEEAIALDAALAELVGSGPGVYQEPSPKPSPVDVLLEENLDLVSQLEDFQEERFDAGNGAAIGPEELQIARRLIENLYTLLNSATPGSLVSRENIQSMMVSLRQYDAAFRGTLPQTRRYTYASNLAGRNAFPVNAGSVTGVLEEYMPPTAGAAAAPSAPTRSTGRLRSGAAQLAK
ncbi:hypothetical protein DFJ77DRAFT_346751 [Powellomyces hirtus]|nr:hypothetical protein DFJ77DRAFT_346751 [Powellomyces hirtus]